jgi:sugar phosphate isomerase/epimerase
LLRLLGGFQSALHFFGGNVFDVGGQIPGETERIFEAAAAVAIELVFDGTLDCRPGGHRLSEERVDVGNVKVQEHGAAADGLGAASAHLGVLIRHHDGGIANPDFCVADPAIRAGHAEEFDGPKGLFVELDRLGSTANEKVWCERVIAIRNWFHGSIQGGEKKLVQRGSEFSFRGSRRFFVSWQKRANRAILTRITKEFMKQSFSRRSFLAASATAAAGFALQTPIRAAGEAAAKRHPVGLELYSVRDELSKDLPNTLKTVAKIGYEVVEFYSPYFKWTPAFAKDVRTQLDDLGLRCYSTHNSFESFTPGEKMAHAIELNQILGCRYIVLASAPGGTKGVDGWKSLSEKLSAAVEQLKPHGLSAGYHNHQAEWAKLDNGQRIMEVIAANTPKEFALQLDVGTCEEAGVDPVAWVKSNPGRIKMMHMKDWAPESAGKVDKGYGLLFGEGITQWKELIAAAESVGGIDFYLIEQEGSRFSPFETVKKCLENWKALRSA